MSKESPTLTITARTTEALTGMAGRGPRLKFELDDRGVKIEILHHAPGDIGSPRAPAHPNRSRRASIPVATSNRPWIVHFGRIDQLRRVAIFEPQPGARP